ncbi:MAG: ExbD/TolR family protein [Candidatus Binatia bacterium]
MHTSEGPAGARRSSDAQHFEESAVSIRALRRGKRQIHAPLVNLTSMVDVLSVLMFFLLSIYSGGGYLTILPSGLQLPNSNVRTTLTRQVEVAVLKDKILVDRQLVGDDPRHFADSQELVLPALQSALSVYDAGGSPDSQITIEADRSIPFRLLKKVMYTADQAGFRKQSLAVRQVTG